MIVEYIIDYAVSSVLLYVSDWASSLINIQTYSEFPLQKSRRSHRTDLP